MVNELKDLSRIDVFKSILKNNKEMTLSLFGLFLCIFVYEIGRASCRERV